MRKRKAIRANKRRKNMAKVTSMADKRPTAPSIQPTGSLPGPMQPQGSDGNVGWGGWSFSNETNPDLVGENLYRTFAKVLTETIAVAAAVRYSLNLIRGLEWSSTPNPKASSASVAQECADLVRDGLLEADMPDPWNHHVAKQSLFAWYGNAIHNWIWRKRGDGTIVYADLQHRPQHTIKKWDIRVEGEPWRGVIQQTRSGGNYYLERSRLWYTADRSMSDGPQGTGLLRHVLEHARRLSRFEQLEGYAFDANLRGIPIGRAPLQALDAYARTHVKDKTPEAFVDEQTEELRAFLTNHIKTPEQGLMLDSITYTSNGQSGNNPSGVPQWAVDLLQGDDMGMAQIAETIKRINGEILRVMGCEWMLMGGDGDGSRAMHTDKTAQYGSFLNGIVSMTKSTARNDLARPVVAANKGAEVAEDATPLLEVEPISNEDIRTITGAMLDMVNAGSYVPPDDPVWNQIRRRAHLATQMKIPPSVSGALVRLPRDPNDPNNPDNGGNGFPGGGPKGNPDPNDPNEETPEDKTNGGEATDEQAADGKDPQSKPKGEPKRKRRKIREALAA